MRYDDVLEYINGFGIYQKRIYLFLVTVSAIEAYYTLMFIFTIRDTSHSCRLPTYNDTRNTENYTVSSSECSLHFYNQSSNSTSSETCHRWTYDADEGNTMTSEFDLVCENEILQTHGSMSVFGGHLVGTIIGAFTGDTFGRRPVLIVSASVACASTMVCVFAPSYSLVMAMRFLMGLASVAEFQTIFIINTELVDPKHRVLVDMVLQLMWCVGEVVLCGMAYFVLNWRYLTLIIAVPYVVITVLIIMYAPESPRWLLSRSRKERAITVLNKMASVNGTSLPDEEITVSLTKHSIKDVIPMFKNPKLTYRLFVLTFIWMVIASSYYGLTIDVARFGGSIYLNFLVSVIAEIVGYIFCLIIVDRIGRKWLNCFSLGLAGVACLFTILTTRYASQSLEWTTTTLAMVGKFGVCAAFGNIFIYTSELFPTTILSFVFSVSNLGARIGTVVAPYIADIEKFVDSDFGRALPLLIFGCLFITGGCMSLSLPETKGCKLPENIDEVIQADSKRHAMKERLTLTRLEFNTSDHNSDKCDSNCC